MKLEEFLFELIKFDMEQIRHCGDAILSISSISVVSAFAISAFIYNKSMTNARDRKTILISTHVFILFILAVSMIFYFVSIDTSRSTLEMRECALKAKIDGSIQEIDAKELYPEEKLKKVQKYQQMYQNCNPEDAPHMNSHLEKYPIVLAWIFILLKLIFEIKRITKRRIEEDGGGAN